MPLSRKDFLLRAGAAALPASLAGAALVASGQSVAPSPALSQFSVRQFGAKGDGQAKDTPAIQAAIDAAGVAGGTVYFPAGKYVSGTVRSQSANRHASTDSPSRQRRRTVSGARLPGLRLCLRASGLTNLFDNFQFAQLQPGGLRHARKPGGLRHYLPTASGASFSR